MAASVYAIQFNFGSQENGYVGYTELEVLGSPSGGGSNVLPTSTALAIAAGSTLDLNGVNQQVASLSDYAPGSGGTVTNSGSTKATLDIAGATSTTFSGTIQDGTGGVGLTLSSGTLVLSGTNTYTGSTTVEAGTLVLTNPSALADGSSLTVGNWPSAAGGAAAVGSAAITAVPEPGTLALFVTGLVIGFGVWCGRKRS